MNEDHTGDIQETFQQHEFVSLPTGVDGTQRAYRIYDVHGVVCCDFLLYRTSNERGGALRNEATFLLQNLSHLHAQIQSRPLPLTPSIYCHAITFLGKKAYVLTNESGQLVSTRLLPLLVVDSESLMSSQLDLASISPTHVVPTANLNQYLADNFDKTNQSSFQVGNPFYQLQKSFRFLGLALILLPLLLGLSGVFWGLNLSPLAILLVLAGVLGPVLLTHKASKAFYQFRHENSISIPLPRLITNTEPDPIELTFEIQSQNEVQPEPLPEVLAPQTPRAPTTTTTYYLTDIGLVSKNGLGNLASTDTTDDGETE